MMTCWTNCKLARQLLLFVALACVQRSAGQSELTEFHVAGGISSRLFGKCVAEKNSFYGRVRAYVTSEDIKYVPAPDSSVRDFDWIEISSKVAPTIFKCAKEAGKRLAGLFKWDGGCSLSLGSYYAHLPTSSSKESDTVFQCQGEMCPGGFPRDCTYEDSSGELVIGNSGALSDYVMPGKPTCCDLIIKGACITHLFSYDIEEHDGNSCWASAVCDAKEFAMLPVRLALDNELTSILYYSLYSEYIDINIRKMPDGKWYSMEDMSPFNEDRFYSDNGGECAYVDIDRGDLDEIRSTDCKYTNAEGVLCYQANTTLPLCRSY